MRKGLYVLTLAFLLCGTALGQNKSEGTSSERTIQKTSKTKFFEVNSLKYLKLSDCIDGHFIAVETNKHQGYIFDSEGNLTGKIRVSERYGNGDLRVLPVYSDGFALIAIEDDSEKTDNPFVFSEHRITKVVDYSGNIISEVARLLDNGNCPVRFPYKIQDGMLGASFGREIISDQYDENDHYYMWSQGSDKKTEVGPDSFIFHPVDGSLYLHPVMDGRRLFVDKNKLYGYLDGSGQIAITPRFSMASDFNEGLAAVAIIDGEQLMWGFIDVNGDFVIDPMFSNRPDDFHEGLAVVQKKNGQYVYIDKTGTVVSPEYAYASRFLGGCAYYTSKPKRQWVLDCNAVVIDKSFKEIGARYAHHSYVNVPLHYNEANKVIFFGKDLSSDGYVYTSTGELLLSDVGPFFEDIAWSRKNHCYVNLQGEIILQFVESEF